MRKFATKAILFVAIQLVIGSIILVNYMNQKRYGYMGAFDDKIELLKNHAMMEGHQV